MSQFQDGLCKIGAIKTVYIPTIEILFNSKCDLHKANNLIPVNREQHTSIKIKSGLSVSSNFTSQIYLFSKKSFLH